MKRLQLACVLLGLLAVGCHSASEPGRQGGATVPFESVRELETRRAAFDVEHYALEIALHPERRTIDGICRVRLWPLATALAQVELDLADLAVTSVHDQIGRELRFEHASERLTIALAEPVQPKEFVELTIRYGGAPRRGLWFAADENGVPTQVFTQGECQDARAWFPCFDEPSERATSELVVDMPSTWRATAAGERIERSEQGPRARERWRMSFPHPAYLVSLVAGELVETQSAWDGVPLSFLSSAELEPFHAQAFGATDEILGFFSQITSKRYPYAKYSQACVDNFPFGGMENISATTLTDSWLAETSTNDLVAHEAAHQWFGDLITCNDWSQVWLNEGLATYLTALWTEESRGVDAFRVSLQRMRESYLSRDVGPNRRPVVWNRARDPFELFFSGHVYEGAAVRLHYLRSILGDETFFRGLARYVGDNQGRGVVTADFRTAFEQVAGQDLGWFFVPWFEKPGFPELEARSRYDAARGRVRLDLTQVQDASGSTPAVFRLPLEIELGTDEGAVVRKIVLEKREQSFELELSREPAWVRVDAHFAAPLSLVEQREPSEWRAIAERCDDVVARSQACEVLAAQCQRPGDAATRAAIEAFLLKRLAADEQASVRIGIARALRPLNTPSVRQALEERVRVDADEQVRAAALVALEPYAPDPALAEAAQREFERARDPLLKEAALRLVVLADPARAAGRARAALEIDSAHGAWRARALSVLALVDGDDVRATLLAVATDAQEADLPRCAAARELARIAPAERATRDALAELLHSPRWRVRMEVIAALGRLGDETARAELQECARRSPHALERRAVERALENLGSGS
jgi:aminopeptidase N